MDKVIVVKMGGVVLDSSDTTVAGVVRLQQQGRPLVIVHGGGNMVTEWLKRLGIPTRFVRGERVTDKPALEVAIAVLAGLANKQLVALINSSGGRAVGISGVDGALIQGRIKDEEMGYVGAVVKVDAGPLEALLQAGYIPVVSPVGLNLDVAADVPPILNINGDPVAGEIAAALAADRLIYLTDVAGICDGQGRLIPRLSSGEAEALIASGVASGGMIPKIRACIKALSTAGSARIVDGRQPDALIREIEGRGSGTEIYRGLK